MNMELPAIVWVNHVLAYLPAFTHAIPTLQDTLLFSHQLTTTCSSFRCQVNVPSTTTYQLGQFPFLWASLALSLSSQVSVLIPSLFHRGSKNRDFLLHQSFPSAWHWACLMAGAVWVNGIQILRHVFLKWCLPPENKCICSLSSHQRQTKYVKQLLWPLLENRFHFGRLLFLETYRDIMKGSEERRGHKKNKA